MDTKGGVLHSLVEHEHLAEMQEDLKRKLHESHKKDRGRIDSLRTAIPGMVLAENYERAIEELEEYVLSKTDFPHFQSRAERLIKHCGELIQAIQTKRNFPGLASLALAKQQEIHDKVVEHFEELKIHIKQIENIERDVKLEDVRSTVWVVRAVCHGVVAIVLTMFVMELIDGSFGNFVRVIESVVDVLSAWVVNHFPL